MQKKIIGIGFIVLLVLVAVFLFGRFGWKLRGFGACKGANIQSVEVGEDYVKIKGNSAGLVPDGFCGYYFKEQDGKLYVGFNFSPVFGFFETGEFDVTIPVKGKIQEVILKTSNMESSIWTNN